MTCEYFTDKVTTSTCGKLEETDQHEEWVYCPFCGGEIVRTNRDEQDALYVDAERDFRRGK